MISDESFGKDEHLLKSKDFTRVYRKGASHKCKEAILCLAPNGLDKNRLGFSISSRNVKLATRRNRIRRYFREAYRKMKKDLKAGFDIVIIVRRDPGKAYSFEEAGKRILELAKKCGLAS